MYKQSFVQACIDCNAEISDLDNYIEYWHTHKMDTSLREFLGLTQQEYERWGKEGDIVLENIIKERSK